MKKFYYLPSFLLFCTCTVSQKPSKNITQDSKKTEETNEYRLQLAYETEVKVVPVEIITEIPEIVVDSQKVEALPVVVQEVIVPEVIIQQEVKEVLLVKELPKVIASKEIIQQKIAVLMDAQVLELKSSLENAAIERVSNGFKISFDPSVYFGYNQKTLSPTAQKNINKVVDVLKRYNHSVIIVEGHTDDVGTENQNQQVSERRAKNIAEFMIEKGIEKNRMAWFGLGEIAPIADNKTDEGRKRNRRIHLIITMSEDDYRNKIESKTK